MRKTDPHIRKHIFSHHDPACFLVFDSYVLGSYLNATIRPLAIRNEALKLYHDLAFAREVDTCPAVIEQLSDKLIACIRDSLIHFTALTAQADLDTNPKPLNLFELLLSGGEVPAATALLRRVLESATDEQKDRLYCYLVNALKFLPNNYDLDNDEIDDIVTFLIERYTVAIDPAHHFTTFISNGHSFFRMTTLKDILEKLPDTQGAHLCVKLLSSLDLPERQRELENIFWNILNIKNQSYRKTLCELIVESFEPDALYRYLLSNKELFIAYFCALFTDELALILNALSEEHLKTLLYSPDEQATALDNTPIAYGMEPDALAFYKSNLPPAFKEQFNQTIIAAVIMAHYDYTYLYPDVLPKTSDEVFSEIISNDNFLNDELELEHDGSSLKLYLNACTERQQTLLLNHPTYRFLWAVAKYGEFDFFKACLIQLTPEAKIGFISTIDFDSFFGDDELYSVDIKLTLLSCYETEQAGLILQTYISIFTNQIMSERYNSERHQLLLEQAERLAITRRVNEELERRLMKVCTSLKEAYRDSDIFPGVINYIPEASRVAFATAALKNILANIDTSTLRVNTVIHACLSLLALLDDTTIVSIFSSDDSIELLDTLAAHAWFELFERLALIEAMQPIFDQHQPNSNVQRILRTIVQVRTPESDILDLRDYDREDLPRITHWLPPSKIRFNDIRFPFGSDMKTLQAYMQKVYDTRGLVGLYSSIEDKNARATNDSKIIPLDVANLIAGHVIGQRDKFKGLRPNTDDKPSTELRPIAIAVKRSTEPEPVQPSLMNRCSMFSYKQLSKVDHLLMHPHYHKSLLILFGCAVGSLGVLGCFPAGGIALGLYLSITIVGLAMMLLSAFALVAQAWYLKKPAPKPQLPVTEAAVAL